MEDRPPPAHGPAADTPIENLVSCQENRSFDHYFDFAPQVQAAGFDPPEVTMARTPVIQVIAIGHKTIG
jgi:phospholipase C